MLKDKCAFVTGGVNGIAFACAKRFLQEGAKVTIADIAPQDKISESLEKLGQYGEVYGVQCDVSDSKSVKNAVDFASAQMGKMDIAANLAFIGLPCGNIITEYNEKNFLEAITVNLYGTFLSAKYEAKKIMEYGSGGSIINCSSINAFTPSYGYGAYCSAKAGINALSNVAAIELGKYGIRVNHVCPGFTMTNASEFLITSNDKIEPLIMNQLPLKRINSPEDVADTFLFLASDLSRQITGTGIVVDGGMQNMAYPQVKKYLLPDGEFESLYK